MKVVFIPRSRSPFQVRIVMYTTLHTGFVDVRKKGADNSAIEETPPLCSLISTGGKETICHIECLRWRPQ